MLSQKGNLSITDVLVLLIVVGCGAYYLGIQKSQNSTADVQVQTVPSATAQSTPEPATNSAISKDETELKTYTSQKFNYSLQYPANWILNVQDEPPPPPDPTIPHAGQDPAPNSPYKSWKYGSVWISPNKEESGFYIQITNHTVEEQIEKTKYDSLNGLRWIEVKSQSDELIGNITWTKLEWKGLDRTGYDYLIYKNGYTYTVGCPVSDGLGMSCKRFLSSFKFTN